MRMIRQSIWLWLFVMSYGFLVGQNLPQSDPSPSVDAEKILETHGRREVRVHDPSSIVKCDGEYWLFATGVGIHSWRSNDLVTWERGPRVCSEMPTWVKDVVATQRGHFWAPDVMFHEGRYLLASCPFPCQEPEHALHETAGNNE